MDKNRVQKLIFGILVVSGIGYAYFTYVFSNQVIKIDTFQVKIEEKAKKLSELDMIRKDIKGNTDKLSKMENELKDIGKQIPNANQINQLNLELYYYVKAHNLQISNLEAQGKETEAGKKYGKQPIRVNVTGKKQDIIDFINYLKASPIKMKITQGDLRIISVEEWSLNMKVETYYMKEKGEK